MWMATDRKRERMSGGVQNKPRLSPLMKIEAGREEEMCQPRSSFLKPGKAVVDNGVDKKGM